MSQPYRHIIKKKIINVRTNSPGHAHEIALKLAELARIELSTWLDQTYPTHFDNDQLIKLDKLTLDINELSEGSLADEFPLRLTEAFEEAVNKTIKKQESKGETIGQTSEIESVSLGLFIHFLKTGRLPRWVVKYPDFQKIQHEVVKEYSAQLRKFIMDTTDSNIIQTRILSQLSDAELLFVVFFESDKPAKVLIESLLTQPEQFGSALPYRIMMWQEVLLHMRQSNASEPVQLFRRVTNRLARDLPKSAGAIIQSTIKVLKSSTYSFMNDIVESIEHDCHAILKDNQNVSKRALKNENENRKGSREKGRTKDIRIERLRTIDLPDANEIRNNLSDSTYDGIPAHSSDDQTTQTHEQNKNPYSVSYEEEITIWNAGLVLLWPFLEGFFEGLKLTADGVFIGKEAGYKAVHCLQYLANADDNPQEFEFPLNKVLCGIDMNEPIPNGIELTQDDKTYVDGLIEAMVSNWQAVGSTSIESIRQTYFQREGTLFRKDNGWHLTIEKQTWDILLNELPWGIGMIKLPWNKDIIHVEWN